MNRIEKEVMDRWRRNAAITGILGLAWFVAGVLAWTDPLEEGKSVILNVILIVLLMVGGLAMILTASYGAYAVGVVQGRKGWHEGGQVESFEGQVDRKRMEIEEKLR